MKCIKSYYGQIPPGWSNSPRPMDANPKPNAIMFNIDNAIINFLFLSIIYTSLLIHWGIIQFMNEYKNYEQIE